MLRLILEKNQKHMVIGLQRYYHHENKKQLWIPEGFAHGFYVLSEIPQILVYKVNHFYSKEHENTFIGKIIIFAINGQ